MSSPLLSPDDVTEALSELVEELVRLGAQTSIYIVGGAAVMIQAGREVLSRDIDALFAVSPALTQAISVVASNRNWSLDWLNNAVNMFASHFDTEKDWLPYIEKSGISLKVASCELLLAMKLHAGRGRDAEDIDLLIKACEITTRREVEVIFDRFYPTESLKSRSQRLLATYFED